MEHRDGAGGQDLPDTVRKVRFLPGDFTFGEYDYDIELTPSLAIASPAFFIFGELYDDGTFDDPVELAELIALIYETTRVTVEFDGRILLQGYVSDLPNPPIWPCLLR